MRAEFKIAIGLLATTILICFGLVTWVFVGLRQWREITLTVKNDTPFVIDSIAICEQDDEQGKVIGFDNVDSKYKPTATTHFPNDLGTCYLVLRQAGQTRSAKIGILLTDNGPYDYDVTLGKTCHVEGFVGTKGSWSDHLTLSVPPSN